MAHSGVASGLHAREGFESPCPVVYVEVAYPPCVLRCWWNAPRDGRTTALAGLHHIFLRSFHFILDNPSWKMLWEMEKQAVVMSGGGVCRQAHWLGVGLWLIQLGCSKYPFSIEDALSHPLQKNQLATPPYLALNFAIHHFYTLLLKHSTFAF